MPQIAGGIEGKCIDSYVVPGAARHLDQCGVDCFLGSRVGEHGLARAHRPVRRRFPVRHHYDLFGPPLVGEKLAGQGQAVLDVGAPVVVPGHFRQVAEARISRAEPENPTMPR